MKSLVKNRGWRSAAICFILILSCSVIASGGQRDRTIQPEQMGRILNLAGVEAEAVRLNRTDGFDNGLFFETRKGTVIVLGFSDKGFQRDKPFVLSTFDGEERAMISADGNISFVDEDGDSLSSDAIGDITDEVAELVTCILTSVDGMVQGIGECISAVSGRKANCILDAVEEGVTGILECLFLPDV